jgi:hypothetical protein
MLQSRECILNLKSGQDYLAWQNCSSGRVSAGDKFYSLFKSASVEYTVYRVKWGPVFGQCKDSLGYININFKVKGTSTSTEPSSMHALCIKRVLTEMVFLDINLTKDSSLLLENQYPVLVLKILTKQSAKQEPSLFMKSIL